MYYVEHDHPTRNARKTMLVIAFETAMEGNTVYPKQVRVTTAEPGAGFGRYDKFLVQVPYAAFKAALIDAAKRSEPLDISQPGVERIQREYNYD